MRTCWTRLMVVALIAVMAGASPLCATASQVKLTRDDASAAAPKAHACCGKQGKPQQPAAPRGQCTSCDQAFWSAPGAAGKWDGKLKATGWVAAPTVSCMIATLPGESAWGRPPDPSPPVRPVDLFHSGCLLTI